MRGPTPSPTIPDTNGTPHMPRTTPPNAAPYTYPIAGVTPAAMWSDTDHRAPFVMDPPRTAHAAAVRAAAADAWWSYTRRVADAAWAAADAHRGDGYGVVADAAVAADDAVWDARVAANRCRRDASTMRRMAAAAGAARIIGDAAVAAAIVAADPAGGMGDDDLADAIAAAVMADVADTMTGYGVAA